jgi:hypothetical protein
MPKKEVTGADVENKEVTGESPEEPVETEAQTPDSNERLAKLEAELTSFAEKVEQETKAHADAEARASLAEGARKAAEAERDREVKIRIGHQRETGPKLQELADLKRQQASQAALDEKLSRLEGLVEAMASNSLDPEAYDRINQKIAQSNSQRELERLRAEVQQRSQPAPAQQAPELTPAWKKQLKDELFAEFDVDPLDLTDKEWHQYDSSGPDHWQSQVRAEFEKRHLAKRAKVSSAEEIKSLVAAQVEDAVRAQREEDSKRLAETKAELEELKKAHAETQRLAEEQLNRNKGMDRGHESVSEPVMPSERSINRDLAKLDPSLLYSKDPAEREAYLRARENDKGLRDRILEHARLVQSKTTK